MPMRALATLLRPRPSAPPPLSRLRERGAPYPVLDYGALVDVLELTNRLRSIKRLLGIDTRQYEALYLPAIRRFIEGAQLMPGSASHHHSGLGGLAVHTLEVVELALRGRKDRLLPVHSDSAVQMHEEHRWTMGVFSAALLHDGGKLLTLCRFRLDNHVPWSPLGVSLLESGARSYHLEYLPPNYALQKRLSGTLLPLLPALSRDMMTANIEVLAQVSAVLADDAHEWGEIGEIVQTADRTSVARDLAHGASGEALPNAPASLPKRMMAALRAELEDGLLRLNRDGGGGWYDGTHLWLVCRVATARIARRLRAEGARDVPEDATTLFDLLQEQHYLLPTPEGQAVWDVVVRDDDYCHAFTMLKFAAPRVLPRGRSIAPFRGRIEVVERSVRRALQAEEAAGTAAPSAPTTPSSADPEGAPDTSADAAADEGMVDAWAAETPTVETPPAPVEAPEANDLPPPPATPPSRPARTRVTGGTSARATSTKRTSRVTREREGAPAAVGGRQRAVLGIAQRIEAMAVVRWADIDTEPVPLEHEDIGRYFLTWVRSNLENGTFIMNDASAFVHVLPEGIYLVSPRVFLTFIRQVKLVAASGPPSEQKQAELSARNRVQNRLLASGLAVPNHRKALIHGATVAARPGMRGKPLAGALIPTWVLFDEGNVPPVNTAVTLNAFG